MKLKNTPMVVIIRDGWGANPNPGHDAFNAVKVASQRGLTPIADGLMKNWPWTLIKTSGEDVGLPEGTMGNSEVGHQNIGAGRVVDQESVAITKACRAGLEKNSVIAGAIARVKGKARADGSPARVHLMCIASDAGVHGQLDHLFACVRACKALGVANVEVHLFTDGRDTGPFTGAGYVELVEKTLKDIGVGRVASVIGRYFSMDRDNRWERVRSAYDCLTGRDTSAAIFSSAVDAVKDYYAKPLASNLGGDEFVTPRCIAGSAQQAQQSAVRSGDSVIFVNYRGDRPRELCAAFCFPDELWSKVKPSPDSGKNGFDRGAKLDLHFVIMTEYWENLLPHVSGVAFPKPPKMKNIAGEFFSSQGLRQMRCAETEKYPHVTFFFNDYREEPFQGEIRDNPQSPKVSTYDLKPEMNAQGIRDAVLAKLNSSDCPDVFIVNFANGDMVGHTGVFEAAVQACAAVDTHVGAIVDATLRKGGSLIVLADHGNAEQMKDPSTGEAHTAHTTYDVPCIVVGEAFKARTLRGDRDVDNWSDPQKRAERGRLADVIPTAIEMMGLTKPAEMTGESLLTK